jgi:hypothetical protein
MVGFVIGGVAGFVICFPVAIIIGVIEEFSGNRGKPITNLVGWVFILVGAGIGALLGSGRHQ